MFSTKTVRFEFFLVFVSCVGVELNCANTTESVDLAVGSELVVPKVVRNISNITAEALAPSQNESSTSPAILQPTDPDTLNSSPVTELRHVEETLNFTHNPPSVDEKIENPIHDDSPPLNNSDRIERNALQDSLFPSSSVLVNNSIVSVLSNAADSLANLKNNLVQQTANSSKGILQQLETSAARSQSFFVDNQINVSDSVQRLKNESSQALRIFTRDVGNLTHVIQHGLIDSRSNSTSAGKRSDNLNLSLNNVTHTRSIADIFSSFRNRQMNVQNSLSNLQTQVTQNIQTALRTIKSGWQDIVSRSQLQFQNFFNGLFQLFNTGLSAFTTPFQKSLNTSTNT